MNIRPATTQDAASLARIQVSSYRTAYAGLMPAEYLAHFTLQEQEQDWRDLLAESTGDILLVAETDDGGLAGYALGRPGPVEVSPTGAYDAELVALHVRREFQKQGIGRTLVRAMAKALSGQDCASLALFVLAGNPACFFYERLGAQRVGEKRWTMDDFDFEVVEGTYAWREITTLSGEA
jgi:ribosomal protein S18 acetylase RimI-like enzyme